MTLKGGTSQACASCKYQRRKCSSECPLAPYFPPDQPRLFQNTHKLFGVRKILKILENIDPRQHEEAMRSIIYQANIRDRFPVHGCWGIICKLHFQIRQAEEELRAVLAHFGSARVIEAWCCMSHSMGICDIANGNEQLLSSHSHYRV